MCRQMMALQSVVGCLPAPLRLYFVKSTRWQVEAAFRDEVIAALCGSKFFEFSGDEENTTPVLRGGRPSW